MSRLLLVLPALALLVCLTAGPADAQRGKKAPGGSPEDTLAQVQVAKGLKVEVWAAEPLMANPVAFCFDETGRAFIAETTRFGKGVPDTRGHMYWLDEDLACRTVADRVAMYTKHNYYRGFEKYDDQVRLVWDSTGSGKADKSTVFSAGYNRPEDGLGAGVLARKGAVYFTNIPDLYRLRDTNGDGKADEKESLSTGYGLSVQFLGHDLHGLRMGPDGKLYFSVGDRGFNVVTKEGKRLLYPNTGAVLRCDPDGRNLEVVHWGLRNPQELAFDDYGNLFTYDNNSDSGDQARWVYVVEGGDSGWRGGYQYGTSYHTPGVPQGNRGPWNTEKLWHTQHEGQPAYVVPPLLHFGNGPSGITHYPGVGLSDKYKDHFFCCDFTANPSGSVIWAVSVKPKGAAFEVARPEPFVRGMVPTDCDFGPDGAFYWSDWVGGWDPPGKGRIFRLTDPEAMKNPAVAEAKKLIAEGFEKRSVEELAKLLEHPHQQVRLEAQWELADVAGGRRKPADAIAAFTKVAKESKNTLARLHAVWGLGIVGRTDRAAALGVLSGFALGKADEADPEVRLQALKVVGQLGVGVDWMHRLYPLLKDPDPRVRFQAASALGRPLVPPPPTWGPLDQLGAGTAALFEMLKENADRDPYIRHAGVAALANLASTFADGTIRVGPDVGPPVRLAVVVAYRRLRHPKVAEFLADTDPRVVAEAARAIHDELIAGALPRLAELADKPGLPDAVSYRALSACFKLGTPESAARVAKFAARTAEPSHARVFALKLLADWANPPRRDHITGLIHDLPKRPANVALNALKPVITGAFSGPDAVRAEAARTAAKLGIKEVGPLMAALIKDPKAPVSARAEALHALAALKDPLTAEVTKFALASPEPKLRAAGLTVRAKADPAEVLGELPALLKDERVSLAEKQAALAALGEMKDSPAVDKLLAEWVDAVAAGKAPGELMLDVLEAAEKRGSSGPKQKADQYRAAREKAADGPKGDKLAPWSETLIGGDAEKGRDIFLNNAAVYCQRCHKLDGQGGDVGPAINGLAAEPGKDRRYMLEAIVYPSAQIAKGYETVVLVLADGRTVSGVLKADDKKQVRLMTAEATELVIPADDIEARRTGPSAMPDDLHKKLTRRELRDLVEFLASLKDPPKQGGP